MVNCPVPIFAWGVVWLFLAVPAVCADDLDRAIEEEDWAAVAALSGQRLHKEPANIFLRERRIAALLALGDVELAERELAAWAGEASLRSPAIDALRGDLAFAKGDARGAIRWWKKCLEAQPRAVAILDKLAKAQERLELWQDAEKMLTRRLRLRLEAAVLVQRAVARFHAGDREGAFADMKQAGTLEAANSAVKEWLPRFEKTARLLPRLQRLDRAIKAAPAKAEPLMERAQFYLDTSWNLLAVADAARALRLARHSRRALLLYAGALKSAQKKLEPSDLPGVCLPKLPVAAATLREIGVLDAQIAAHPGDAGKLAARADLLNVAGQCGLAIEDAKAALHIDPGHVPALVELGHALFHIGETKRAAATLERATQLDPQNPYAWLWRAEEAQARAEHADAVEFASRSLALTETPAGLRIRERSLRVLGRNAEAANDRARLGRSQKGEALHP